MRASNMRIGGMLNHTTGGCVEDTEMGLWSSCVRVCVALACCCVEH